MDELSRNKQVVERYLEGFRGPTTSRSCRA